MKNWTDYIFSIIIGILFFVILFLTVKEQINKKEFQQKLNFLCSPGVYIETISNSGSEFAVCLMKQNSKEFVVKEIVE